MTKREKQLLTLKKKSEIAQQVKEAGFRVCDVRKIKSGYMIDVIERDRIKLEETWQRLKAFLGEIQPEGEEYKAGVLSWNSGIKT